MRATAARGALVPAHRVACVRELLAAGRPADAEDSIAAALAVARARSASDDSVEALRELSITLDRAGTSRRPRATGCAPTPYIAKGWRLRAGSPSAREERRRRCATCRSR